MIMTEGLSRGAAALRAVLPKALNRQMVAGMFIGAAVMLSAVASADDSSSSSWWSSAFSTGGDSSSTSSQDLISQQDSVVAAQISAEVVPCSQAASGTVGGAIQTAMTAHQQIASATPAVESLFDVNSSCFSSINQIFDLSFAIPSLASILSSAESAVMQYAQKQICTAVNQVTGMVTTPINQAIGQVNSLAGFADINGMANGSMTSIDPNLGSTYHAPVAGGTYTTGSGFTSGQTTFSGGSTSGNINSNTAEITALTAQIAQQQITINTDTQAVQSAQSNYSSCNSGEYDCSGQYNALVNAQQALIAAQQTLNNLQLQLSQVVTGSTGTGTTVGTGTNPGTGTGTVTIPDPVTGPGTVPYAVRSPSRTAQSAGTNSSSSGTSWWSTLSGAFH